MSLTLLVPPTHAPERAWVWGILLGERLGLSFRMEPWEGPCTRIQGPGPGHLDLVEGLFARPDGALLSPEALPVGVPPVLETLPVAYGEAGVDLGPDGARIRADVAGTCFFLLSRMEECIKPERDLHGRFPSEAAWIVTHGHALRPLVEGWAAFLEQQLRRLWPALPQAPSRSFTLRPTHDIDWPSSTRGLPPKRVLTILAKDLLWRRQPGLFTRRLASALGGKLEWDPFRSHRWIMAESERRGLRSTFYFMACPKPGALDGPYTLDEPWARSMVREVQAQGHEVGLHPSLVTRDDLEGLRTECGRLSEVLGAPVAGARQHYLKWNPATWVAYEACGLTHDASPGFTDRMGFRCGTCHDYPAFDLRGRRALKLRVRPLHYMDTSFYAQERELPRVRASFGDLGRLAAEVRRFGGTLNLLWHNNFLNGREERAAYLEALSVAGGAW